MSSHPRVRELALQVRVAELEAALTELVTLHERDVIFDGVVGMSAAWGNARAVLSRFELNQTDKSAGRYIARETMEPGSQTPKP